MPPCIHPTPERRSGKLCSSYRPSVRVQSHFRHLPNVIAVSAGEDSVKRLDISSCPLFDAIKLVHFYAGSWSCIQVDMNEETAACSRVPLDAVRCAGNNVDVMGVVGLAHSVFTSIAIFTVES